MKLFHNKTAPCAALSPEPRETFHRMLESYIDNLRNNESQLFEMISYKEKFSICLTGGWAKPYQMEVNCEPSGFSYFLEGGQNHDF